ncbi:hypothetical protein [Clostridium kluyveri]|uniref:Uncharacterized protein n=1 Tax=Clostridium kluyveri (strain ATCC 8527 / DSM 555 / NBRC 12016 / NCIMB 10680 / K1) TaxID=431943 RepID=A5N510_CLOK5|nr:hypothetical protein [Clostridium kluyveri]EDK32391.1 Hypothetical protein CKL_0337 [Clostridium kluyveri DSM 555]
MITIIITAALLICVLEGIPLFKKKMWKELLSMGFILLISLLLEISKILNIITPINFIEQLFKPLGKILFNKL